MTQPIITQVSCCRKQTLTDAEKRIIILDLREACYFDDQLEVLRIYGLRYELDVWNGVVRGADIERDTNLPRYKWDYIWNEEVSDSIDRL